MSQQRNSLSWVIPTMLLDIMGFDTVKLASISGFLDQIDVLYTGENRQSWIALLHPSNGNVCLPPWCRPHAFLNPKP